MISNDTANSVKHDPSMPEIPGARGHEYPGRDSARWGAWRDLVERTLDEWRSHPERLDDDGIKAPTPAAIAAANKTASHLQNHHAPLPTNLAPTGDGGISFLFERGDTLLTIEVSGDGRHEVRFQFDNELVRIGDDVTV